MQIFTYIETKELAARRAVSRFVVPQQSSAIAALKVNMLIFPRGLRPDKWSERS